MHALLRMKKFGVRKLAVGISRGLEIIASGDERLIKQKQIAGKHEATLV